MGERHIRVSEDFVSCDWCRKEEKGLRCGKENDIERVIVGNIQISAHDPFNDSGFTYSVYRTTTYLTGLEMDLCKECRQKFYDHIQSFIPSELVKNKPVSGD